MILSRQTFCEQRTAVKLEQANQESQKLSLIGTYKSKQVSISPVQCGHPGLYFAISTLMTLMMYE